MGSIEDLSNIVKDIMDERLLDTTPIVIKKINDILKLKVLPDFVEIDGIKFQIGGGSGSLIGQYLREKTQIPYITISAINSNQAQLRFGATTFSLLYKVKGISLVPDKIIKGYV